MSDFDFSLLKSNVPSGFRVLVAENNSFNVLHNASKREYRITWLDGQFHLYAGSRIQHNKFDFVWKTASLHAMLSAIGYVRTKKDPVPQRDVASRR